MRNATAATVHSRLLLMREFTHGLTEHALYFDDHSAATVGTVRTIKGAARL
jgi:hypothetical protein